VFLGHFAVALAARPRVPRVSLGWLFAATQLPDLLWPPLLLLGIERVRIAPGDTAFTPLAFESYPWSHSLLMVGALGVILGTGYLLTSGRRPAGPEGPGAGGAEAGAPGADVGGAAVLALIAVSHWVLDAATHRPDLPLTPSGATRIGFGLWNSVPLTLVVELAMFGAAIGLYLRSTAARDRTGRVAFWSLIACLGLIYAANVFGPPPPGVPAIAYAGLGLWLFVLWGSWVDRHRGRRGAPARDAAH
jgi:hypothetical protein